MTNPGYKTMNKPELKAYVLSHHEEEEAIRELFARTDGKRKVFPIPQNDEEARKIFEGVLY